MQADQHQPVLLEEVIANLAINPDGIYVDATFGRGGHSEALLARLSQQGKLLALDQDWDAVAAGREAFQDERFIIEQGSFTMLRAKAEKRQWVGHVNGILFDLGVSSPQLDTAERGFSFLRDGPLDMRMDQQQTPSASDWLNQAQEKEIAQVIRQYGEERFAKKIANAIVDARRQQPILRTLQLAEIISQVVRKREPGKHPATRTFQAIRIFINRELDVLQEALQQSLHCLAKGGRLLVISFHSLEDRIVKRFMQKCAKGDDYPSDFPIRHDQLTPTLKIIGRAIRASQQELAINPRARSATLRVAEKIV